MTPAGIARMKPTPGSIVTACSLSDRIAGSRSAGMASV